MSSSIRFNKGGSFLLDGREVQVTRVINGELVTLEDVMSLVVYQYSMEQLLTWWAEGRVAPKSHADQEQSLLQRRNPDAVLSSYPPEQVDKALWKKRYLDGLRQLGVKIAFTGMKLKPLIKQIADQLGDLHPPSPSSIYRWFTKEKRSDSPAVLLDRFEARGWFGCRFPVEVQEALIELIEERYLEPPGCSIVDILDALRKRLDDLNVLRATDAQLELPSYDTVRRAIKAYPAYEHAVAKYGQQEASIRFRTSMAGPKAKYILEVAEIDHTPVDLFVVDERTGLPLGRPTLTILVDRKSKMILGIYVSFGGPSTEAVFQCLRHAILPKNYLRERYPRVEGLWPCFGLMQVLVCDNGLEFHSKALEQACFELGITLQFCPKRKPYFKGMVERAFRSISRGFFHAQKGTSLANWMDRHGYDPLKTAVATFDEFLHALHIWIVDVYSVRINRGLKRTPLAVWQNGVHDNPPRLPDLKVLDQALTEYTERTLWHYGIELHKLRYNSKELFPIRHQHGEKVTVQVRYNRGDLGHIYVIHPSTGEAIKVPAIEFDYASGLRLEVHELICREVREAGLAEANPLNLAKAKERIRDVIGQSLGGKKLQQRKRAARLSGANSQDAHHVAAPRATSASKPPKGAHRITVTPKQFKCSFRPWGQGGKP
ncbi:DDE-type integrase/transposase/recombinase [Pseudogulbenkiania sp. MAI-1]|uniref:Mu transposase C-terminal domain-containing protein n=1 Tax=Pseudogulbenkiania sp. MAI-1 TaxID=990370 RepID=UPI00045EC513|nr:DDE-type integrase/transposase/recombinase [Pseudogulbenkiania sp. MAI-1]